MCECDIGKVQQEVKALSLRIDAMNTTREEAREEWKHELAGVKSEVITVRKYLLGNGEVKDSIVYKLDWLVEKFNEHLAMHGKVETRAWDLVKPLLSYILAGGLGAAIMYYVTHKF